ncbi:MAG: sigma factor, partial [Planctomycetota bacterium]
MTRGQFLTDRHERAPREQARFIELFAGARLAIRRTLLTYLGHAEDADDLLQETGVVLWERFDEFEQNRSFASWACGIAANKARMLLRDRRRHRTLQLSERAVA